MEFGYFTLSYNPYANNPRSANDLVRGQMHKFMELAAPQFEDKHKLRCA